MNGQDHDGIVRLSIKGRKYRIHWPPTSEEEWEILRAYFDQQDRILHAMRRAIVSLEKKVHWGMPTRPILKRACPYRCQDDEGNPVDPIDPGDEGDGGGGGGPPPTECGEENPQDCDIEWD
jgi:hypothetical protein